LVVDLLGVIYKPETRPTGFIDINAKADGSIRINAEKGRTERESYTSIAIAAAKLI